ncbi:A24 family peptidase [Paenibacillus bovis]|uniref:prepilin peptidase n=1 Tax=Paenibacillus bovis TaxID=1616788 RepID=UPI001313F15C
MINVILISLCIYFSVTDIRYRTIPNRVIYPLFIILFLWRLFTEPSFLWGLIPSFIMFISFFCTPNSIGAGDVKLVAVIGLFLGIEQTLLVVFLTCLSYIVYAGGSKLVKKRLQKRTPLAPFLAAGVSLLIILQLIRPLIG